MSIEIIGKTRQLLKRMPGVRHVARTSRELHTRLYLGPLWSIQRRKLMHQSGMSLRKFVALVLGADDIVFDIGANTGDTALLMASCVGRFGRVCAFEPNPVCFSKLEQSAKIAWNHNLGAYPFALSDMTGTLTLLVDLRGGGGASTVVAEHAKREQAWHEARYSPIAVTATTLDVFCETSDFVPTFLKVDVEGAEEMVIRGGRAVIARHRPLVWFECWCGSESGMQTNQNLGHFEELLSMGYSFFLATIFKLDGRWIPESDRINPTQLLPLEPQLLKHLPVMGCDILAATKDHLERLKNCGLISDSNTKHHLAGFSHGT